MNDYEIVQKVLNEECAAANEWTKGSVIAYLIYIGWWGALGYLFATNVTGIANGMAEVIEEIPAMYWFGIAFLILGLAFLLAYMRK